MHKRVFIIALIAVSIIPQLLLAEIDTLWTQKFYGIDGATFTDAVVTTDGGYLAGGTSDHGYWYVGKVDIDGNWISERYYGQVGAGSITSMDNLVNGYVLAGGTIGQLFYSDFELAVMSADGDTIWTRIYGDSTTMDACCCTIPCIDQGYIMAGYTNYDGNSGFDICLLKTDSIANMEWFRTYGDEYDDYGKSVVQTDDGGYFVVGYGQYASMLLVDSLGNEITHINDGKEYTSVVKSSDGNYVVAGGKWYSYGEYYTLYIAKVDSELNLLDWKEYGNAGDWTYANSIDTTSDGGYILTGDTGPAIFYEDGYILKVDANFEKEWDMRLDVPNTEVDLFSIHETSDGNYIAAGRRVPYAWLLKLGEVQDIIEDDSVNLPNNYITLTSYPNPFNTSTTIKFVIPAGSNNGIVDGDNISKPQRVELSIYDLSGRKIAQLINDNLPAGEHSITWNAKKLSSGIYFCRLSSNNKSITKKMVLLK